MKLSRLVLPLSLGLLFGCPAEVMDPSGGSTGSADSSGGGGGDDSAVLGCAAGAVGNTSDGASDAIMDTWGAACTSDADCVALLGEGAVCDNVAVIYELPGGYCTKPCTLPDGDTRVVPDDPTCDPNGGVACIGAMGFFERCAIICTDDMQCSRDGYICRQLPMITGPDDPTYCLMPDCCETTCAQG